MDQATFDQLERLAKLRAEGSLTESEFDAAKAKLLWGAPPTATVIPRQRVAEMPIDEAQLSDTWRLRFGFIDQHGMPSARSYTQAMRQLPFLERARIVSSPLGFLFGPFYYAYLGLWRPALSLVGGSIVCPAMTHFRVDPMDDVHFSALLDVMSERQFTIGWEKTGNDAGIIRAVQNDRLTGKTTKLSLEVRSLPPSNLFPACRDGVTLIESMAVDDEKLSAFELDDTLSSLIERALSKQKSDMSRAPARATASPAMLTPQQPQSLAPVAAVTPAMESASAKADDDDNGEGDQSFYAKRAEVAKVRSIIVSDDGTTWCCLTIGDIAKWFSSSGASSTIGTSDDGKVTLDITDPSGRWNGWRSFALTFDPDPPGQRTPLRPASIEVDGKQVMSDDASGDVTISQLLRRTFKLHQPPIAKARFSAAYDRCMGTGDAAQGIQIAMNDCMVAEYRRGDDQLNETYHAKMAQLPRDRQQALRTSERAWLRDREIRCAPASDSGTLAHDETINCYAAETTARVGIVEAFR